MLNKEIFNPIDAWEKCKDNLKILIVVSAPIDEEIRVSARAEITEIHRQLAANSVPVAIIKLVPPTFENLKSIIRKRDFDIIHFIGHADKESIQLETRSGEKDKVSIQDFTNIFQGTKTKLVVLNNCNSKNIGDKLFYNGPLSIIGTSAKINNNVAVTFSSLLYSNIFSKMTLINFTKELNHSLKREFPEIPNDLIICSGSLNDQLNFYQSGDSLETTGDAIFFPCEPYPNIPPIKNDIFFDRIYELIEIYNYFSNERTPFIGISGIAGKGKSIIATAAAQKYGWLFNGGIAYFSFRKVKEFRLADLFRNFNWGIDNIKFDKRFDIILSHLSEKPILLILDDLEESTKDDKEKIVTLLSNWDTRVGGKAILTMRERDSVFDKIIQGNWVNIGPFPEDAAWELLIEKIGGIKFAKNMFGDKISDLLKYCHNHPQLISKTGGSLRTGTPWNHLYPRLKNLDGTETEDTIEVLKNDINNIGKKSPASVDLLNSYGAFVGKVSENAWKHVACGLFPDDTDYNHVTKMQTEAISTLMRADIVQVHDYNGHHFCEIHALVYEYLVKYHWNKLDSDSKKCFIERQIKYYIHSIYNKNTDFILINEHSNIINALYNAEKYNLWNQITELTYALAGNENCQLLKERLWERSLDILKFGILSANKINDKSKEGDFLFIKALCNYRLAQYNESLDSLKLSNEIALLRNDINLIIKTENEMGRIAYRLTNYQKALKHFNIALECSVDASSSANEAMVLHQLGRLYYRVKQFTEARECLKKSLEIRKNINDQIGLGSTYHELARLYHLDKEYSKAEKTYRNSLELREKTKDLIGLQATLHQIGLLNYDLGNYEDARYYYKRCINLSTLLNDLFWKAHNDFRFGKLLFKIGQSEEGVKLVKSSKKLSVLLGIRLQYEVIDWIDNHNL